MVTQSKNILLQKVEIPKTIKPSLIEKYNQYAKSQSKQGILWFLKVIILIPCIFMVFSIIAMSLVTPHYIWFVGLSMVLFFLNVIAHIGEAKSTFFVPLYHATVSLFILIPFIVYLIQL